MRVTIITAEAPPMTSGIGDHSARIARALAGSGHQVEVICRAPADRIRNVDIHPVLGGVDTANLPVLLAEIDRARPDSIVWAYNPFQVGRKGLANGAGRIARALARKAPLIVFFHEIWFPWGRSGLRGLVWATAQRLQARRVIAAAAKIIVTTEQRADEMRKRFPRADIALIPIGANIEPDETRPLNGTRARLGVAPEAFVVAHFGSMGAGRDLTPAYDALRVMRSAGVDARLICVGRTGGASAPVDLAGAVTFTGLLPETQVSDALRAADAYLFCEQSGPSLGRKGSLLAAFAHGLPVVAFAGPDSHSALRNGENVFLVQPDGGAIASTLERVRTDEILAKTIGTNARRLYDQRFAWPVVCAELEDVLRSLHR